MIASNKPIPLIVNIAAALDYWHPEIGVSPRNSQVVKNGSYMVTSGCFTSGLGVLIM